MRLMMYDRSGRRLAQIDTVPTIEAVLNGAGKLSFTITTNHPKCREEFLRYGNLVLLEDDVLGDWGGVVRLPRGWPAGKINITAHEAPALFNRRKMIENVKLTGSAGNIYRQIIDYCNGEEDLRLRYGQIWDGGVSREETLSDRALLHVQRVAQRNGNDFQVRPVLDDQNRLTFFCDWLSRAGIDTGKTIEEGKDLTFEPGSEVLIEDVEGGELINRVVGIGDASTTGTRPITEPITNEESRSKYGLGTDRVVFSGNVNLDTVTINAENYLANRSVPQFQVSGKLNGRMLPHLRKGNVYSAKLHSVGFAPGGGIGWEGRVRALSYKHTYGASDADVTFGNP